MGVDDKLQTYKGPKMFLISVLVRTINLPPRTTY